MSTLSVGTIQSNTSAPPVINNTSGTQIGTFCRAFCNFNGTGTVAIRAAFNVSSITDNGTGTYTVNFTNTMPDANYSAVVGADNGIAPTLWCCTTSGGAAPTTSAVRVQSFNTTVTLTDANYMQVAIFR